MDLKDLNTPAAAEGLHERTKFPMDCRLCVQHRSKLGLDIWAADGERHVRVQTSSTNSTPLGWWRGQSNRRVDSRFTSRLSRTPPVDRGTALTRWQDFLYPRLSRSMRFSANGDAVEAGRRRHCSRRTWHAPNTNRQQYAVSPDGQSFILNSHLTHRPPDHVILNWNPR